MTKSKIEWTDRSWKLVKIVDGVATLDKSQLIKPLQWRKPQRCFMGDIFAKGLSDTDIDKVFAVMSLSPHITFQILTKRPERMLGYCIDLGTPIRIASEIMRDNFPVTGKQSLLPLGRRAKEEDPEFVRWPVSNVWLGVSVHDQDSADEFVPLLLGIGGT